MSQTSKYTAGIIYVIANQWIERYSCSGPGPCITGFIKEGKDKSQMAHELLVCG